MSKPQIQLRNTQPIEESVTFQTDLGQTLTLTKSIVKQLINPNVTDQEVGVFLKLCLYQRLNPFIREVYLIKYGNSPATMVTGKEVFLKRAMRNPRYRGLEAGILLLTQEGELQERAGTLILPGEQIVGGWARVYVDGHEKPAYQALTFDEYCQYTTQNGERVPSSMWKTKAGTMIRKCAVVATLREAFPEELGGLYDQSEINTIDPDTLPQDDIIPVEGVVVEPTYLPIEIVEPQEPAPTKMGESKAKASTATVIDITSTSNGGCEGCGTGISEKVADWSRTRYGRALCVPCQKK